MGTYSQIVREIRSGGQLFESVEFVHENRRTNGDAHRLARSSLYTSTGRHVCVVTWLWQVAKAPDSEVSPRRLRPS